MTGFDPKTKSVVNGADWETMYKIGATTPSITKVFTDLGMKFIRPSDAGLPSNLMYLNKRDFNPRVGFAYKFSDGPRPLVVRGGYSIFGYDMPLRAFDARMRQNPPTTAAFTFQYGQLGADARRHAQLRAALQPAVRRRSQHQECARPQQARRR